MDENVCLNKVVDGIQYSLCPRTADDLNKKGLLIYDGFGGKNKTFANIGNDTYVLRDLPNSIPHYELLNWQQKLYKKRIKK